MSWLSQAFNWLTGALAPVLSNKNFEAAAQNALKGIGELIVSNKDNPTKLEQIGTEIVQNTGKIVGTIVAHTEAQGLVSPEHLPPEAKPAQQ
jgi:hypothetical protein